MATWTWKGGQGPSGDVNDYSLAANWVTDPPVDSDTFVLPEGSSASPLAIVVNAGTYSNNTAVIGTVVSGTLEAAYDSLSYNDALVNNLTLTAGGNAVAGDGAVVSIFDTTLVDPVLQLGNNATLDVAGDGATTGTLENGGSSGANVLGSAISGHGNSGGIFQTGASLVINGLGNGTIESNVVANVPGGFLTIDPQEYVSGTTVVRGALATQSGIIADGEAVNIPLSTSAYYGNQAVIMLIASTLDLAATMLNTAGGIVIAHGSTADIDTLLPGAQIVNFNDDAGELLKIEAATTLGGTSVLAGFVGRIGGFAAGDTIELVGITGLSSSYADGVLTLSSGGGTVGTLRFLANQASDSSLGNDGFVLTTNGGNTFVTTNLASDSLIAPLSGTVDWGTVAAWSGGALPAATQMAVIANSSAELAGFLSGSPPAFTVTVSTAELAGSVVFENFFATLEIGAALTLAKPAPLASSGGSFEQNASTVIIGAGGALSATRYVQATTANNLSIEAGGSLVLSGLAPFAAIDGYQALEIESQAQIEGSVTADGAVTIGQNGNANVTLDAGSVTAAFTQLGGQFYGNGNLAITGSGTTWRDVGDAANPGDTGAYLGDMVLGGGGYGFNGGISGGGVGPNGFGGLFVENGATLSDSGWGILGVDGFGAANRGQANAMVQSDATWEIGQGLEVGGSHFYSGNGGGGTLEGGQGNLTVSFGGQVRLGGVSTAGLYTLAVGFSTNSTGQVSVSGFDGGQDSVLDASAGPVLVGGHGAGTVSVDGLGTIEAGVNAASGIGWAVMIGAKSGSSGMLSVDGDSGVGLFASHGDLVDGVDGAGSVIVNGGSLAVSGTIYVGGTSSGVGSGTGSLSVDAGQVSASDLHMYANAIVGVGGSGTLRIGNDASGGTGLLIVGAGGTIDGAGTLGGGGNVIDGVVAADITGRTLELNGTSISGGGTLEVTSGGVLRINVSSGSYANTLDFNGAGTLMLEVATNGQQPVHGFGVGDTVDLPGVSFPPAGHLAYDPGTGILSLDSTSLDVGSGYFLVNFGTQQDSGTGTDIVYVACYAAGTRVLTAAGERPVETLAAGDVVPALRGGGLRRVRWVGRTRIDMDAHPRAWQVAPVCVGRDAFGPGVPHRDLVLSPDHAVFVDDVLIPVHLLVNGATVRRLPEAGVVEYYHIELDSHDLLLAEGLPTESYLDTGNRGVFAGEATRELHPDLLASASARAWDGRACAELLLGGVRVDAVRAGLRGRAEALGFALTDRPGLRVLADGRVLAARAEGERVRVAVPAGTRMLRLLSGSFIPDELDPRAGDRRRLGVAVAAVRVDGRALDAACFGAGFHPPEADGGRRWRWTDGAAQVLLPACDRACVVDMELDAPGRHYWLAPDRDCAGAALSG